MGDSALGITIVGGGVYAPRLCEALARAIPASVARLSLSARDPARLQVLAAHAAERLSVVRPGWSVVAAPSLDAALEHTSLVILLARVGGLAARAWDEEFPRRYGLVGDEGLGPGGIANAWRTVPELDRIAGSIGRVAPEARILNLMAPLGITTRLLLDRGLAALGLCDLPVTTLQRWLVCAGASPEDAGWNYAGLYHLGWFWGLVVEGRDLLQDLSDSPELVREGFPIDGPTLQHYHAAPLRYYYEVFDPAAGARLGMQRRHGRARELSALADTLLGRFAAAPGADPPEGDRRPTPWLDLAVAPIAAAMLGGPPHRSFVNLRNGELLPELPPDQIVELAATFSGAELRSVRPGPLPSEVTGFLREVGNAETLAYRAALRRDPDLLTEAMAGLPLPIGRTEALELAVLARQDTPST
jgi:6-phospho-beta-glucosidase